MFDYLFEFYKPVHIITHGKDKNDVVSNLINISNKLLKKNGGQYRNFYYFRAFCKEHDVPYEKWKDIPDIIDVSSEEFEEAVFDMFGDTETKKKTKYHDMLEKIQSIVWWFVPGAKRPDPDYGIYFYGYNGHPILSTDDLEKTINLYRQKYNDKIYVVNTVAIY